jgi:NAD(P)-dependent dehydrogenase (short-subunit alcohol dehydrogenase family)
MEYWSVGTLEYWAIELLEMGIHYSILPILQHSIIPSNQAKIGASAMNLEDIKKFYDLTGRTVVVTGGTGVLGSEIACFLLSCHANVAVIDRNTELSREIDQRISEMPGKFKVIFGDVLQREIMQDSVKEVLSAFGRIDFLINAAGGNHPNATTTSDRSFFDLPLDAIRFTSDLNLLGTILPSQIISKLMAEQGEGVIINVSSMNAFRPLTRVSAYSAAKAAVSNFTQWLAVHLAQEYSTQIRVNAIAPGFFLTEQNRFLLTDAKSGELTDRGKKIIEHTPLGRFGKPEDLFAAILWLLSPVSNFVTGIVLPIDGGFSAFSGV